MNASALVLFFGGGGWLEGWWGLGCRVRSEWTVTRRRPRLGPSAQSQPVRSADHRHPRAYPSSGDITTTTAIMPDLLTVPGEAKSAESVQLGNERVSGVRPGGERQGDSNGGPGFHGRAVSLRPAPP